MQSRIAHPSWCRGSDCVRAGAHESAPITASAPGDLMGIEVTLVQLADDGPRLVRLALTDDDVTTVFALPTNQALTLHYMLGELVNS
ncbi:hypothetical protein DFJ67_7130 [Asanoa ferruginea]|uniref:Uncharacterized protein n=1 Tax=Asanoa ferruginea TaxID=53367 RepID=A0A3D9ZUL4_9ACTN|nr:hypothetical protein [Asanoa ferruginea]REG01057.1 hypothetical protein DFJ67_7130 [Asanoa ferruginea]GIF47246.1 hypothetical protein Afe04nite_17850 [Asanoa ferruginea]